MRVLITGGAGYIGSHTAKALAGAGHEPIVLDNLSTGRRDAVKWGPLVEADLAEPAAIRSALSGYEVEAVIHFAASVDVGESVADPQKYYRNNVVNTLNLLDAMLETGIGRIVFSSSCAIYGVIQSNPVHEDHPQLPINPYGESKRMVERILAGYEKAFGLNWMALRYFNAAGADPEGEIGSNLDPEPSLIPRAIDAALGVGPELQINGTDYPTPDGTCVRDYVHVSDLAAAHILALGYLADGGTSTSLNLGTGRGFSVCQVIEAVERISGRTVPVRIGARRAGDAPAVVADAGRAADLLGWTSEHSDLEQTIRTAWEWRSRRAAATDGAGVRYS